MAVLVEFSTYDLFGRIPRLQWIGGGTSKGLYDTSNGLVIAPTDRLRIILRSERKRGKL
jgi:hypothetical protein